MWAKCAGKGNFNLVAECELPEATEGSSDRITIEDGSGLEVTGTRRIAGCGLEWSERSRTATFCVTCRGCPVQKNVCVL
jgi:hypothetical protein